MNGIIPPNPFPAECAWPNCRCEITTAGPACVMREIATPVVTQYTCPATKENPNG